MDDERKQRLADAIDGYTDPEDPVALLSLVLGDHPRRVLVLRSLRQALNEMGEDDTHDHIDAKQRAVLYHKLEKLVEEYRAHVLTWAEGFTDCKCADCQASAATFN